MVNPNYESIELKKPVFYTLTGLGEENIYEYDTVIVRKAYVILKPQFSKLSIKLCSLKDLPNEKLTEFFSGDFPSDVSLWDTKLTILDPYIVKERMNKYVKTRIASRTIFMEIDVSTLAKIKLVL